MDQETGVTSDSSTDTGSEPATANEETVENPQPQKPPKGYVPYQALEEERSKRKQLEEQLANSTPSEEFISDEGKELRKEIRSLNDRIRSNERKEARREVEGSFPVLKERKEEFDSFLEDEENKRLSIGKAATLFMAENNLLAPEPPKREVLEKPSGGGQAPPEPKLTDEEIENLRKNDWRKYEKLLLEGKI